MIKKFKSLISFICIFCIMSTFALTVFADDGINISVVQDKKSGKVTLECQIDGAGTKERVTFIILRPGKSPQDISLDNPAMFLDVVSYFDEKAVDENGAVSFTFPLDKNSDDGTYVVKVGGTFIEVPLTANLNYTNFSDESKLIRINNAITPEKMRDVIGEEFSVLDKDGYGLLSSDEEAKLIDKLCTMSKNGGFETIPDFALAFNGYVAVGLLNDADGAEKKVAVLENKSEVLMIDAELGEKTGTEDAFKAFAEKYDNESFVSADEVSEKYLDMLLANCVKNSRWSELYERLMLLKAGGAEIDLSPYDKIKESESTAAKTMQALAGQNVTLKTFDDALADAVSESGAKNDKDTDKKPSGGSGGGGTGGAGLTAAVKNDEVITETEEPKKEIFSDLDNVSWAKEAVNYLFENGIVSGKAEGIFAPNDFVKREEFVKMLVLALGESEKSGDGRFIDVEDGSWYAGYIYSAVEKSLINGIDENLFGTGEGLTREQLATIIGRALEMTDDSNDVSVFKDGENISDYAKGAVLALYKNGVISGKGDGIFAPKDYTTRAEAAKMLYEVIKEAR